MTQQAKRYLSLIIFFVASGYFIWLGDETRIFGLLPARPAGYLFAAIAIAGLLGFNIWIGGPLDKRKDANLTDTPKTRSYRVIYHIGDTLDLRTKGLQGRASLTEAALTITGPSLVDLPVRELRGAELFRLHGLARCVRISHQRGTIYVAVVRFVLFGGYFASINFLQTGELARRLREAIGGGGHAFQQAPN